MDQNKKNKSAGIYPEPGKRLIEGKILSIKPFRTPWFMIALLGLMAALAAIGVYAAFASFDRIRIAHVVSVPALYIVAAVIAITIALGAGRLLAQRDVRHPYVVAWLAVGYGLATYLLLYKRAFLLLGTDARLAPVLALVIAGPLLLPGIALLVDRLPRPKTIVTVLTIVAACLLTAGLYLDTPKPAVATVAHTPWALQPDYLPTGVKERGNETCDSRLVIDDSYSCAYYFDTYPGYLSQKSQTNINRLLPQTKPKKTALYEQPYPFFKVSVARDAEVLKPYQFKYGRCDIANMAEVANTSAKYRASDAYTHKPRALLCGQVATPGSKGVYYELPSNSRETDVQVATRYYFKQSGNVVIIQVGSGSVPKTQATAYYLTDPGFQEAVYKFIDSF